MGEKFTPINPEEQAKQPVLNTPENKEKEPTAEDLTEKVKDFKIAVEKRANEHPQGPSFKKIATAAGLFVLLFFGTGPKTEGNNKNKEINFGQKMANVFATNQAEAFDLGKELGRAAGNVLNTGMRSGGETIRGEQWEKERYKNDLRRFADIRSARLEELQKNLPTPEARILARSYIDLAISGSEAQIRLINSNDDPTIPEVQNQIDALREQTIEDLANLQYEFRSVLEQNISGRSEREIQGKIDYAVRKLVAEATSLINLRKQIEKTHNSQERRLQGNVGRQVFDRSTREMENVFTRLINEMTRR